MCFARTWRAFKKWRECKTIREKVRKSFVVNAGLILALIISFILHNLFFAIFRFEDTVFSFASFSLIVFIPIHLIYSLILALIYCVKINKKV